VLPIIFTPRLPGHLQALAAVNNLGQTGRLGTLGVAGYLNGCCEVILQDAGSSKLFNMLEYFPGKQERGRGFSDRIPEGY